MFRMTSDVGRAGRHAAAARWLLVGGVLGAAALAQPVAARSVVSRPVVQPLREAGPQDLSGALARLARNPADIEALISAGKASLALGDAEAALGFLTRANQLSPGNPRVTAILGRALVRNKNPY